MAQAPLGFSNCLKMRLALVPPSPLGSYGKPYEPVNRGVKVLNRKPVAMGTQSREYNNQPPEKEKKNEQFGEYTYVLTFKLLTLPICFPSQPKINKHIYPMIAKKLILAK